ncbi:uncharacterized protein C16orf96 homolog isoform X4 [Phacochoerus africanus]|uniref:uncharacterized protein C16orf96 homolog isoform X4 n=1 Tax=Phacochoerus africanus TaxID=41426 RepID=UPI001FD9EC1F|nr:uncharacterized protein C16orf96 homolog isoform X4 [Phacochoerus africanus]
MDAQNASPADPNLSGMSFSLTFSELVNIALPQCGVLNFKALHLLLQGILEHIHMAELKKVLPGDEDFLQTPQAASTPREGDVQPILNPMKRLCSVFDQVVSRVDRMESQLALLQDLPSTSQLLEGSKGTGQPAQDLWQQIKLRKMVEGNEEAVAKSMKTLQDLLTDIYALKVTIETLKKDVAMLKVIVGKIRPERIDTFSEDLKGQNRKMSVLQEEVISLQSRIVTIPKPEDVVLWSSLHEAMFTPGTAPPMVDDADLWRIAGHVPEMDLRTPERYKAASPSRVSEAIRHPRLLESVWHYQVPGQLPEEESPQEVPLSKAQEREQPQTLEPGPRPGPGPAPGPQPTPAGSWPVPPRDWPPPRDLMGTSTGPFWGLGYFQPGLGPPGSLPAQLWGSGAPPPAVELGSAWPRSLWSRYRQAETPRLSSVSEKTEERDSAEVGVPQDRAPRDGTPKEALSEGPQSDLQRLKSSAAAAAAAAATYAAAATSAARAAKAAARLVRDTPATKLPTIATATATSGPSGVPGDIQGTGSPRGASSSVAFTDDGEPEHLREMDYEEILSPSLSPPGMALSQAMLAAKQATTPEDKKKAVRSSMNHMAWMPVRHDSLKGELAQLSASLEQRMTYLANMGASSKLGTTVDVLQEKIGILQKSRMREEELERIWGHQIEMIKDHHVVLDRAVDKLQTRLDELKVIHSQIKNLEIYKADKTVMEQELKEKADRSTLASKASRADLDTMSMELNEMIQGMLFRVMANEDDWKKAVAQLGKDLRTKEAVRAGEMHLLRPARGDDDRPATCHRPQCPPAVAAAAGQRQQLRVPAAATDEQAPGPPSCIVPTPAGRNASLPSLLAPLRGGVSRWLLTPLLLPREQQRLQKLQSLGAQERSLDLLGSQQDWGDSPRNDANLKFKSCNLSTLYPYGDPELLNYDTAEVDILGVDGILYKGRMSNKDRPRLATGAEKELAAVKAPRPPAQNPSEGVRPGDLLGAVYPYTSWASLPLPALHPQASMDSPALDHQPTAMMPAWPLSLLPSPQLPLLLPSPQDPQPAPGPAKHPRPLRLESRAGVQPTKEPTNLTVSK